MNQPATIAALGAGRMGRGIALAFAYAGHPVWLLDVKPRDPASALARQRDAQAELAATLDAMVALGAFPAAETPAILARIRYADRPESAKGLAEADFVFEGVPEVMGAKREAFAFAGPLMRPEAVLASTTSTMLVTTLAGLVARPERFLNAHWLNPPHIIPLVELSPHPGTAPEARAALIALLEGIGKVPIECAAAPGYIVPRLQSLIMNEAARMVEEGVATPEAIDKATRYGFGFRYANMGVVEFIDYGGNDILYYASRYLAQALGSERYASPPIVARYMHEGRNGLREGRGFYDFTGIDVNAYKQEALGRMLGMLNHLGLQRPPGSVLRQSQSIITEERHE
ncbi:MAG: 3-hydroxybutyryl-CoA dehydrogenase [Rhodospirillales bacterium]|nr:3-hydroxybutyryl-CoA dehydrogenase [Rhodospirillales bacterium]